MFITFEVMMAIRYLRAKNIKFCSIMTLFSILGIALGVATLIVVMSVMNGFRENLLDSIIGINGHINVYFDKNINPNYDEISESIKKIPGVLQAIPITNDQVVIEANGNIASAVIRGIAIEDLLNTYNFSNKIMINDIQESNQGVIIGKHLAEVLNTDYITLILPREFDILLGKMPKMQKYKIIGTFDMGMLEYDSTLIYMPLKAAQSFFAYKDNIRSIEVFVDKIAESDKVAEAIEKATGMRSESWQVQQSHYLSALNTERNVMFLILTLIIVVAAFNIVSNLMIIVQEKKSAIAIMRTFGATNGSIMRIFCICGVLIGFIGTFIGCIIGITFSLNIENIRIFLEKFINVKLLDPMIYFFSSLPVILIPQDVINVSALALFLSLLATIIPALQATSQDPAEILRYE